MTDFTCTYCGAWDGTDLDHVIPAAASQAKKHFRKGTHLVLACSECNVLLGSKLFITVPTRAAYLLGTLRIRYKKILKAPIWEDDEFEDLGYTMKAYVLQQRGILSEIHRRLGHLEIVASQ